jgi:hypothetical protein
MKVSNPNPANKTINPFAASNTDATRIISREFMVFLAPIALAIAP